MPKVGVTLGDPSGIGPEIVAAAVAVQPVSRRERLVIFGDKEILAQAFGVSGKVPTKWVSDVVMDSLSGMDICAGAPNPASDAAQVRYLEAAVTAARAGQIAALATAPISKVAARRAGFDFPGHTEFLQERFGAKEVAMMFAGPKLKVVLATVHEGIANLPNVLTQERIVSAITLAARALIADFGIVTPRIGVLGLNPHAGEEGQFGDEEARVIGPAMEFAQKQLGADATLLGPLVPDAAFRMADIDCFVAMYHDQGLIPVKLLDFDDSVNTTLGLPIVRTSPDHGVAYDIAGQGKARSTSMRAAIDLAFRLVDGHLAGDM